MAGGHNLNAPALGLALDQIDQEAESRRVNPIFQLLDEVERGGLGAEQRGEDCRGTEACHPKHSGPRRSARPSPPISAGFDLPRLDRNRGHQRPSGSACGPTPGGLPSWRHPHRSRPGRKRGSHPDHRVLSAPAGRGSASGSATDPGTGRLSAHEERSERVLLLRRPFPSVVLGDLEEDRRLGGKSSRALSPCPSSRGK